MKLTEDTINKALPYLRTLSGNLMYVVQNREDLNNLIKYFPELDNKMMEFYLNHVNRGGGVIGIAPVRTFKSGYRMAPTYVQPSALLTIHRPLLEKFEGMFNLDDIEGYVVSHESELDRFDLNNLNYSKAIDLLNSGETVFIYEDINTHVIGIDQKTINFATWK